MRKLEPAEGLEPPTRGLQNRRSTSELRRRANLQNAPEQCFLRHLMARLRVFLCVKKMADAQGAEVVFSVRHLWQVHNGAFEEALERVLMTRFLVGVAALAVVTVMMTGSVFSAETGELFVGSAADVAALQSATHQLNPNKTTTGVHVVGDYALLGWEIKGFASGQFVFKRISDERWKKISPSGGGGAIGLDGIVHLGVPTSVAKQLCSGWPKGSSPC